MALWSSLPPGATTAEAEGALVTIEAPPLLDSHTSLCPAFHALVWHGSEQYRGALAPKHALHRLSFKSVPSGCPQKLHTLDKSPITGDRIIGVRVKGGRNHLKATAKNTGRRRRRGVLVNLPCAAGVGHATFGPTQNPAAAAILMPTK